MGKTLQGRPLFKTRKLPPGINRQEKIATTMEHRAFEKISSIEISHFCSHESNLLIRNKAIKVPFSKYFCKLCISIWGEAKEMKVIKFLKWM